MKSIAPTHLSVVSMTMAALILGVANLAPVSSSYAQIEQDSSARMAPSARPTPIPASLQVTVLYPADGTVAPGENQVVRADVTIGPPEGVSPHKYGVVTKLSDALGNVVRSHTFHPAGTKSVEKISMRRLPPGDYMFSTDLLYAGTLVAQSGSSKIKKTGRPTPTPNGSATPVSGYATTWMANTFRGGSGGAPSAMHMQQAAADLTVIASTGLSVLNHNWDEGQMFMGEYATNGTIYGEMDCPSMWTGGASITNNGTYIYAAQNNTYFSGSGYSPWTNWVGRWNLNGTAAGGFTGATGNCTNLQTIDASPNGTLPIWGLAASSTEVFIADPSTNQIKVYDTNLQYKRAWSFTNPRRIAYDPSTNTLWISQGTNSFSDKQTIVTPNNLFLGNVYHQDLNGNSLSGTITDVAKPSAIVPYNNKLYIADDGPDQQIKIYTNAGAHASPYTFGDQGGFLSGSPGVMAASKLLRPNGIGFDDSGNMYVLGAAGTLDDTITLHPMSTKHVALRKYNSSGALQWQISAAGSNDDSSVVDPTSESDWYSAIAHFKFDYSKLTTGAGGGGQESSWYGSTLDPFTYPHDPRQYQVYPSAIQMRSISGNKYLAVTDEFSHQLMLFKMVGEIAKPMNVFASWWPTNPGNTAWPYQTSPTFYWFDSNNDGEPQAGEITNNPGGLNSIDKYWNFDANGDVWVANYGSGFGIGRWSMQGVNGNGQLTYNPNAMITYGKPAPFTQVNDIQYDAANDIMYVSGYTAAQPPDPKDCTFWSGGTVLARYNNWLAGNRTPAAGFPINLPYGSFTDPNGSCVPGTSIRAFSVAGGKIFAGLWQTGYSGSNPNLVTIHNIYVYDASTGALLGEMQPGVETNYMMGWIDENQALFAFQRSNGEYVVNEEEQWGAKHTVLRGMLNNFTQY